MYERVAQYFCKGFWLIWPTVRCQRFGRSVCRSVFYRLCTDSASFCSCGFLIARPLVYPCIWRTAEKAKMYFAFTRKNIYTDTNKRPQKLTLYLPHDPIITIMTFQTAWALWSSDPVIQFPLLTLSPAALIPRQTLPFLPLSFLSYWFDNSFFPGFVLN